MLASVNKIKNKSMDKPAEPIHGCSIRPCIALLVGPPAGSAGHARDLGRVRERGRARHAAAGGAPMPAALESKRRRCRVREEAEGEFGEQKEAPSSEGGG